MVKGFPLRLNTSQNGRGVTHRRVNGVWYTWYNLFEPNPSSRFSFSVCTFLLLPFDFETLFIFLFWLTIFLFFSSVRVLIPFYLCVVCWTANGIAGVPPIYSFLYILPCGGGAWVFYGKSAFYFQLLEHEPVCACLAPPSAGAPALCICFYFTIFFGIFRGSIINDLKSLFLLVFPSICLGPSSSSAHRGFTAPEEDHGSKKESASQRVGTRLFDRR